MWQSIIKAWGNKRVDPWGNTRKKGGELKAGIRYFYQVFNTFFLASKIIQFGIFQKINSNILLCPNLRFDCRY